MNSTSVDSLIKRTGYYVILLCALVFIACEPEEEQISGDQNLSLTFSTDTVLFDTLLTAKKSLTRRFRIYNPNSKAINIADIRLAGGSSSDYSIIINGKSGTSVQDEVVFGRDSLLVLVDVTIDPLDENTPYLVKDSVVVEWNGNSDHVKLVAWGQDANFIKDSIICDQVWTKEKPYVLYNVALVDAECTLTVEPGTKIFLDNDASLFVAGSLRILGDSGNHVTIRNTRFDENYLEAPGQWGGIYLLSGSKGNEIHYADIENGTYGLSLGNSLQPISAGYDTEIKSDLEISHSSIRHMSVAGILAFGSEVYAYNTEVYNVKTYLVGNFAGGNYRYEHCTFANNSSFFLNDDPLLQFSDNLVIDGEGLWTGDLSLQMTNCIAWGRGDDQLIFSNEGAAGFDVTLLNNILKLSEEVDGNYVSDESNFPGFYDPLLFDFSLDSLAFARDKGIDIGIVDDINGMPRDTKPDIGAFERIDKK